MERFIKGDVVVIPFPFSDLSGSKKRPALVLSDLPGEDILLCQITSQQTKDIFAVPLAKIDFKQGFLPVDSFIRPFRIFTADKQLILRKVGSINSILYSQVTSTILKLIQ